MTEPNEPKIVHFPPRAQAPVQDTAGNWEPEEQLFGLEELLQQLPPIRKLHLEKAGLMAYSHGEYFAMGKKIGSFGYSVRKKHPKNPNLKKKK